MIPYQTNHSINAVLFDFDLTLADSTAPILKCVQHALEAMSIAVPSDGAIKQSIGLPLPDTFSLLSGVTDKSARANFARLFIERADQIMVDQTLIYPEVPHVLTNLRGRGIKTGIVSTKFRYRIDAILKLAGLRALINSIVGGEDVTHHKPDPEGIMKVIEDLGTSAKHVLYIGDHLMDAQAARNANVGFYGVTTGLMSATNWDAAGESSVQNSIVEILDLMALGTTDYK